MSSSPGTRQPRNLQAVSQQENSKFSVAAKPPQIVSTNTDSETTTTNETSHPKSAIYEDLEATESFDQLKNTLPVSAYGPILDGSASIFERSVDNSTTVAPFGGPSFATHTAKLERTVPVISPTHNQLLVDNQIPAVLDASVEAITSHRDLSKVEIVTVQPSALASHVDPAQVSQAWSEEENISTAQLPRTFDGPETRLPFVSYADLIGIEQVEAESALSIRDSDPALISPASLGQRDANSQEMLALPSPAFPVSSRRRQRSIVRDSNDLELARATMSDAIQAPMQYVED